MAKSVAPFGVNSSTFTAYIVQTKCQKVIVCEVNQAGTTDYFVAYPTASDGPRQRPAGKEFVFQPGGWMNPGDTPFFLKTALGSPNFDADEQ